MSATLDALRALGACAEAVAWVRSQPDATPAQLWSRCDRGDWMLWLLARTPGADRGALRRITARCACLAAVSAVCALERRGLDAGAIRVAALAALDAPSPETLAALRRACRAAAAYAYAAYAYAAAAAAYAAADAADDAAAAHAAAADAAAAAAADAADADARRLARMASADIVRAEIADAPEVRS